jgi:hypothetical protein
MRIGITVFLVTALVLTPCASAGVCDADALYSALHGARSTQSSVGGGEIDVVFDGDAQGLDRALVLKWVETSALAVSQYFGRYPVTRVAILVVAEEGARVVSGTTYGFGESAICLRVGRNVDAAALRDDWILVHEMTHLALPDVPRASDWLLEGNATYVEPIARAQAGQLDASVVWRWALEGMPKGLPKDGDRGLDHTPTWGRTYWGGALFWLLADIRIQQRSDGRFGVQDALRAINRKSGGNTVRWSVRDVLKVGDAATGTNVLTSLYDEMKDAPVNTNLGTLFGDLGVSEAGGRIVFNDQAPLARVRERITAPHASKDAH